MRAEWGTMFEEDMRARLPKVCGAKSEMQRGGGTKKKEMGLEKRESNKSSEAEEDRGFGKWGGGKDQDFEEDSGGLGGYAGSAAGDCGGTTGI